MSIFLNADFSRICEYLVLRWFRSKIMSKCSQAEICKVAKIKKDGASSLTTTTSLKLHFKTLCHSIALKDMFKKVPRRIISQHKLSAGRYLAQIRRYGSFVDSLKRRFHKTHFLSGAIFCKFLLRGAGRITFRLDNVQNRHLT